MEFNKQLQTILFFTSLIGLIYIFKLVKRKQLNLKYSFLWVLIGSFSVGISVFPEIVNIIRQELGMQMGSNALFLLGIYFLIFLSFSLTVIVSRHMTRLRRLNQEVALLKKQIEELRQGDYSDL